MSVRRGVRGSFRGSLRRYGSAEYSRRPYRHHNWVFRNGEWRIAFGQEEVDWLMSTEVTRPCFYAWVNNRIKYIMTSMSTV
ncbi:hypothetical protein BLOT_000500 [Blomia tropicalis]|nr:hypothetical protein BLOT_000500 [Blomia tropicalis]